MEMNRWRMSPSSRAKICSLHVSILRLAGYLPHPPPSLSLPLSDLVVSKSFLPSHPIARMAPTEGIQIAPSRQTPFRGKKLTDFTAVLVIAFESLIILLTPRCYRLLLLLLLPWIQNRRHFSHTHQVAPELSRCDVLCVVSRRLPPTSLALDQVPLVVGSVAKHSSIDS
ncbi:hypothetical protein BX600DRAFT_102268 [Xylariales sp. PMI_506]|nr:hypothetical protein BX600DRAFT_102268 [Xylariales sp. PMI_506]